MYLTLLRIALLAFLTLAQESFRAAEMKSSANQGSIAPANDNFQDAAVVTANDITTVVEGTTVGFTWEPGEPFLRSSLGSVWYRWTAPFSGRVQIRFELGAGYVNVLEGESFAEFLENEDNLAQPRVVNEGTEYFLQVQTGSIVPSEFRFKVLSSNDNFMDSELLPDWKGTNSLTFEYATPEAGEPDVFSDAPDSVWFKWRAPANGSMEVRFDDAYHSFKVYIGTDLTNLARLNTTMYSPSFKFAVCDGETFHLRFSGVDRGYDPFPRLFTYAFTPSLNEQDCELSLYFGPPANDMFENAIEITGRTNLLRSASWEGSLEPGEPGVGGCVKVNQTLWWKYVADEAGMLHSYAPREGGKHSAYTGTSIANLQLVGTDCSGSLLLPVAPGDVIYYQVERPTSGELHVRLHQRPNNDDFADRALVENTFETTYAINTDATVETGEPVAHPSGLGRTLWYSWIAPADGVAALQPLLGTGHAVIYRGDSLETLFPLSGVFPIQKGEVFQIQLEALEGNALSAFSIWMDPVDVPENDHFASSTWLDGNALGEIDLATREPGEPEHLSETGKSLWWGWQAQYKSQVTFELSLADFEGATIIIYAGDTLESCTELARGTDSVSLRIESSTVLKVAVVAPLDAKGRYRLRVITSPEDDLGPLDGGTVVQNGSFADGEDGLSHWTAEGTTVHLASPLTWRRPPHGTEAAVLVKSGSISQEVGTAPGTLYRLKFAFSAFEPYVPSHFSVTWNEREVLLVDAYYSGAWSWTNMTILATDEVSRLTIQNHGMTAVFDAITLVPVELPPLIQQEPLSLSSFPGGTVYFDAEVSGTPPLHFVWYHNGTAIPDRLRSQLLLEGVTEQDAGEYFFVVSNDFGAATSSIVNLNIELSTHPAILVQPAGSTLFEGDYLGLSVYAAGTPPLSYQWLKDGAEITGATEQDLVITNATPDDAGNYSVQVSNSGASVLSLGASIAVLPPLAGDTLKIETVFFKPIYDLDGITPLVGDRFVAQLYAGVDTMTMRPVAPPFPFNDGRFSGMPTGPYQYLVPSIPVPEPVWGQVRVWERTSGATYEHARAAGGIFGRSPAVPFQHVEDRPSSTNTTSGRYFFSILYPPSFQLQAGLPQFTTGKFDPPAPQLDGTVEWSFNGAANSLYLVEAADSTFRWTPHQIVTNQLGSFSFVTERSSEPQFFRARILD